VDGSSGGWDEHSQYLGSLEFDAGDQRVEGDDAAEWYMFLHRHGLGSNSDRSIFTHSQGLDLYVYRSDGTTDVGSRGGRGTRSKEPDGQRRDYYVKVYGYNGAREPENTLTSIQAFLRSVPKQFVDTVSRELMPDLLQSPRGARCSK
jgi:hypothetical protein